MKSEESPNFMKIGKLLKSYKTKYIKGEGSFADPSHFSPFTRLKSADREYLH